MHVGFSEGMVVRGIAGGCGWTIPELNWLKEFIETPDARGTNLRDTHTSHERRAAVDGACGADQVCFSSCGRCRVRLAW